ncbi:MAG: prephenate dehydrogenase/arogenate dehydrogenase family protein [Chloroflexi bacterium]|nr:prephenate dehydrogenase/arogenate dehydrogenase family protein [Chloroflexota bacterium]
MPSQKQSQITIIGLGLVGASLGLAIKKNNPDFLIVGHDKQREASKRAREAGAVDKDHWNLIAACENADMVVLAIPAGEIPPTLEALKQDLKPGCLTLDTASIKRPVLEAARILPETVHFVGTNPILLAGGADASDASADLFKGCPWAICATSTTSADAIQVTADMVKMVGAQPFFLDADEHDGLMAAVDGMPLVVAAAMMNLTAQSPAWRELWRVAGSRYEIATHLPDLSAGELAAVSLSNADNIVHWIDALTTELRGWRDALTEKDEDALVERFDTALTGLGQWFKMRQSGDWDALERPSLMEETGILRRIFLGASFRSRT